MGDAQRNGVVSAPVACLPPNCSDKLGPSYSRTNVEDLWPCGTPANEMKLHAGVRIINPVGRKGVPWWG